MKTTTNSIQELVDQFLFDRGSKTDALVDWQLPDTLLNK